ncbi:hypothetical protein VKT23_009785 [Stygiomarasmius scandens]|uniref:Uncharacterized protein n=1 Tax=Marasmiellus scandens TaxID=2682957 RepID=A0ABR1JE69_9AGAR
MNIISGFLAFLSTLSGLFKSSLTFFLVILLVILIVTTTLLFILFACAVFSFHTALAESQTSKSKEGREKVRVEERRQSPRRKDAQSREVAKLRHLLQVQTERVDNLVLEAHRQLDAIRKDVSICKCQRDLLELQSTGLEENGRRRRKDSGSDDSVLEEKFEEADQSEERLGSISPSGSHGFQLV